MRQGKQAPRLEDCKGIQVLQRAVAAPLRPPAEQKGEAARAPQPSLGRAPARPVAAPRPSAKPASPATIGALLAEAREQAEAGVPQADIVEWVCMVAERHYVRVRHDSHPTFDFVPGQDPLAAMRPAEAAPEPAPEPAPESPESPEPAPESPEPTPGTPELALGTPEPAPETAGPAPAPPGEPKPRRSKKKPVKRGVPLMRMADGSLGLDLGSALGAPAAPAGARTARGTVCRLVLSNNRGRSGGVQSQLFRECNGLVVDARSWRVLAAPPGAFASPPAAKAVDPLLAEGLYDVIPADDGTVVTLYRWAHPAEGPCWALGSSGGYDVSDLLWFGPLTYAEVFYDLATRLYPDFCRGAGIALAVGTGPDGARRTRLDFVGLAPDACYTVGFRHHNFHPLRADPERMWQIQGGAAAPGGGRAPLPGIPGQTLVPAPAASLAGLRALGAGALEVAAEAAAGRGGRLDYGFILRSRDPARTGAFSDVLVDSPLHAAVRRLVYEQAPRAVRDDLTATERLEYNALRAFLTPAARPQFLALFPEWAGRFQQYTDFVEAVVRRVVHDARQLALGAAVGPPEGAAATVAAALHRHISRYEDLGAAGGDTASVVRDYATAPEHALLYLRALRR